MNNEFLTYESPLYKIKIDYPASWIKVDKETEKEHPELSLADPAVVAFMAPREKQSNYINTELVGISVITTPKEMTLDKYIQESIESFRNSEPDLKILESIPTWLSSADMPAHKFMCSIKQLKYLYIATITPATFVDSVAGNVVYLIAYIGQSSKYHIYLPIAQKMIDSFRIME
jgi:hypothetical protein